MLVLKRLPYAWFRWALPLSSMAVACNLLLYSSTKKPSKQYLLYTQRMMIPFLPAFSGFPVAASQSARHGDPSGLNCVCSRVNESGFDQMEESDRRRIAFFGELGSRVLPQECFQLQTGGVACSAKARSLERLADPFLPSLHRPEGKA